MPADTDATVDAPQDRDAESTSLVPWVPKIRSKRPSKTTVTFVAAVVLAATAILGIIVHHQLERSVTTLELRNRPGCSAPSPCCSTPRNSSPRSNSQSDSADALVGIRDRQIGGGPDPTGPCTGQGLRPGCEHLPARHLPLRCGEVPQSDLSRRSDRGGSHAERGLYQLSERRALGAMNRQNAYDLLDPDDDSVWTGPDRSSVLPGWIRRLRRTVADHTVRAGCGDRSRGGLRRRHYRIQPTA